jgi:hypothetical protein
MELGRASALFEEILGHRATTTAAPGWTVSPDSLEVQDALGLSFASDVRGTTPFYPVMAGRRFRTLQIPTTLPTADELLGENGITTDNIHEFYGNNLRDGLNVLSLQAEFEGGAIRSAFVRLLERFQQDGVRCITLGEVVRDLSGAPACSISMGQIPGQVGNVAIQGQVNP